MTIKPVMSFDVALFMNVAEDKSTPEWARMNKGIEDTSVGYNATVNTNHFIGDKGATKTTTALDKSMGVTQLAFKGDKVFEFVDDIFFNDSIGDDATTEILEVYLYKVESDTAVPSKVYSAIISQNDLTITGGEQLTLAYDANYSGDATFGTSSIVDGAPVFTETPKE